VNKKNQKNKYIGGGGFGSGSAYNNEWGGRESGCGHGGGPSGRGGPGAGILRQGRRALGLWSEGCCWKAARRSSATIGDRRNSEDEVRLWNNATMVQEYIISSSHP
jgi:hypothetical protein